MAALQRKLDVAVGRNRYNGIEVPEDCTVGQWKKLLGQGSLGAKILYPERLVCRGAAVGAALEEASPLPAPPGRLHVTGPHTVVKMLELALKDFAEAAPKRPPAATRAPQPPPSSAEGGGRPRPPPRRREGAGPLLRQWDAPNEEMVLQVQCPASVAPGSSLQVEDPRTGKVFEVVVPEGTLPGGTFEIRPPDGKEAAANSPHEAASGGAAAQAPTKGQPSASSVLAAPLDQAVVDEIRSKHPNYEGDLPQEAYYWSEADLARFLASGGERWPSELSRGHEVQTCALLRQLRLHLAERRISEATAEYRAFCRHLREVDFEKCCRKERLTGRLPLGLQQLPALGSNAEQVPHARRAPERLQAPVVLETGTFPAVGWDLDFWLRNYGEASGRCRARGPAFAEDPASGPEAVGVVASVEDYVNYARLLAKVDPACREEDAVAYFRVHMEGWPAFSEAMWDTFTRMWKELTPPGVEDLTVRWVQLFADKFGCDWLETLSRYYTVSLAAPGCITRLRRARHGAHTWVAQTEGRSLVFLFAPSESERLYVHSSSSGHSGGGAADAGGEKEEGEDAAGPCRGGWVDTVSPVDIFSSGTRRYPRLRDATALTAVLERGETLVVPAGWWWYSAALEPSATVEHRFYNRSNFESMAKDLESNIARFGNNTRATLDELRDEIFEDNEDWGLRVRDQ